MVIIEKWIVRFYNFFKNRNEIAKNLKISKNTKITGSTIRAGVKLENDVTIVNSDLSGTIKINSNNWLLNVILFGNVMVGQSCRLYHCRIDGRVNIGKYTSIWGPNSHILSIESAPIKIGNFCSVAKNVSIQSFNHNYKKATSYFIGQNFFKEKWENERVTKGEIIIGNDVWIGSDSVILGGVIIEDGAVVAANSVVTKNVSPYAIVAGSPAKVIGYRFDKDIIEKFQEIQWWNWNDLKIKNNKHFFEKEITKESFENIL